MKIFKKFPQPVRQYMRDLSLVVIGFMLNYIPELLSALPGFFGKIFTNVDIFVKTKISMEIPAIVLCTIAAILIHHLGIIVLKMIRHFKKPPYLKFTTLDYKHWRMAWEYVYLPTYKRYNIRNIRPVCKKCGCDLIPAPSMLCIVCPACGEVYPLFTESAAVEKIIEHEMTKSRMPNTK